MERLLRMVVPGVLALAAAWAEPSTPAGLANGDFEAGAGGWRAYESAAPQTVLAGSSERPHSGTQALRFETPGKGRLEGVTTQLTVPPGHSCQVDVWLRGSGTLMLAVLKRQGWVYGHPFTPGLEWSRQSLRFLADAPTAALSILATGSAPQAIAVFVDDVTVGATALPTVPAATVAPFRCEAEEYRAGATYGSVTAAADASAGAYVVGRRHYWLAYNVPLVPQTSVPFFIYLRARAPTGTQGHLTIMRALPGQPHEGLGTVPVPATAQWEWVRSGPHTYGLGTAFGVVAGAPDPEAAVALDAIVIATDGTLTAVELNRGEGIP